MRYVALTGSRFSGKDLVAEEFKKMGIKVFDADTILKFIMHYKQSYVDKIVRKFGTNVYDCGVLRPSYFETPERFDELLDIVESEVISAFNLWASNNSNCNYIIFMYSVLFERKLDKSFDCVINVHAPRDKRSDRMFQNTDVKLPDILNLMYDEMDEIEKNRLSNFVIHNYNVMSLKGQIQDISHQIIINKKLIPF